jgi:2-hydroxychromene-2-carboxylate isomerase
MTPVYIIINEYGHKYYYKDKAMTILHREDGPAIEFASGYKAWYSNGVSLSEREFLLKTAKEIVLTMDEIASKFGIDVSKLKITK